jgi:cytochrome P450
VATVTDKATLFPIGSAVTAAALAHDPYEIYRRMRESEPISWVGDLNMYYVVRYDLVYRILKDPERFTVGTERSTLFDTFGAHLLTVEDPLHARYKSSFAPTFLPGTLRETLEARIRAHTTGLIAEFSGAGRVELRSAFAGRLPILTMLSLLGLPLEHEQSLRGWYDSFERALANFQWDAAIRTAARDNVERFRRLIRDRVEHFRQHPDPQSLLSTLAHAPREARLDEEAIERNALIILFGGISTVEALILNALYALSVNPDSLVRVRAEPSILRAVLDETVRWAGPVQSATRHVAHDTEVGGITLRAGETVNCMIAAANRDPEVFADPDRFDIDRPGLRKHLGFAIGPHHCIGSNLAKLEGRIALEELFSRLPGCHVADPTAATPHGSEFRQPQKLNLVWDRSTDSL